MQKIVVAHILYSLYGGVASVAANIINELDKHGIESVIIYAIDDPAMDTMLSCSHKKFKVEIRGSTMLFGMGLDKLYQMLNTEYPDQTIIFHAHNLQTVGLISRISDIPLVCTLHGYGNIGMGFRSHISYVICKMTIAHILYHKGKVVAVSKAVADYYSRRGKQIQTIYNGILAEYKREKQDKFIVAHIGNISKAKGWDKTCEGFSRIDKQLRNNMRFVYAGKQNGYSPEQMKSFVRDCGIESESSYLGFVNNASKTIMPKVDVLVLASNNEGLPVVIIEAFAKGIPVLGTPIAPIKELIQDGNNGFLITDPESIALRLTQLYSDKTLYKTMSQNARKTFESGFTASKMTVQYLLLYQEVI